MRVEELLTQTDAAEILKIGARSLEQWRYKGIGPKFVRISGRAIRYRQSDIDAWVQANVRQSTSEPQHLNRNRLANTLSADAK